MWFVSRQETADAVHEESTSGSWENDALRQNRQRDNGRRKLAAQKSLRQRRRACLYVVEVETGFEKAHVGTELGPTWGIG